MGDGTARTGGTARDKLVLSHRLTAPGKAGVSEREGQVLALLGERLSQAEIAARLFISVRTVESHVASLRRKLNATERGELTRLAVGYREALVERASSLAPALPAPLTSFIGRHDEQAALAAALGRTRLVSAVGPGGIGKTRLALAVAADLAEQYPSGAWHADLVPVTDPALLPATIASAVGLTETSARPAEDALIAGVGRRRALLVLDNCEHLVDAVAVLAERMLAACPALTILVTSRIRLTVPHEAVYSVPGLSLRAQEAAGDAVDLFAERAAAVGVPVRTTAARHQAAGICLALDGMPLAIELAAARLPSLGMDGLRAGLADQLSMLAGGTRRHQRHQSIADMLHWSYRLLGTREKAVLRRVAVFAAPFAPAAAAAVAGFGLVPPSQVPMVLADLAEHSLLVTGADPEGTRYRVLEPVRQFAAAQRDDAEDEQVRGRHLGWCLAEAASLEAGDRDEPGWCDAFDARACDLRAALGWSADRPGLRPDACRLAAALARLLFARGRLREAQRRYEQAADLAEDNAAATLECAAAVAKCRLLGQEALRLDRAAADAFLRAGQPADAAVALARCAERINRFPGMYADLPAAGTIAKLLSEARGSAGTDSRALAAVGIAEANAGDLSSPATAATVAQSLGLARQAGDPVLVSAALDTTTMLRVINGGIAQAAGIAAERIGALMPLARDPRAAFELKDALHTAVFAELAAGQIRRSLRHAEQAYLLPFVREEPDLVCEDLLAPAALAGQWDRVSALADQYRQGWEQAGRPVVPGRGMAPAVVALVCGLRGEEGARAWWLAAMAAIRGVDAKRAAYGSGYGELFEATVLLHHGKPQAALAVLAVETPGDTSWMARIWGPWTDAMRAEAAVLAGDPSAGQHVRHAASTADRNPVVTALAKRAAALLASDRDALLAAADGFAEAGYPYQQARTRILAGGAERAAGQDQLAALSASPMATADGAALS